MTRQKGTKRQRVASTTEHSVDVEPKHQRFTTYAHERGVEIHAVLPQSLPARGLGLVATKRIAKGDRVLFVPEEAMFKPAFSLLRRKNLERISSQAKLALSALLHFEDASTGLRAWLDTWPTVLDFQMYMPLYWSKELTQKLPSSFQSLLERQLADYNKDWTACADAVLQAGHDETLFKYHWMIVNSRSFHWAPPKGGAGYMVMCPFIDYLNHGQTGTGCNVFQRSDGYEVLAQRAYEPGEELLISYGAHVNEKLLVHYGFILPYSAEKQSIDDEVRIDDQVLPLLPDVVKEQLSDLGYLGPFALVPVVTDGAAHGWEPCFKTQVAIRATFLTCNEWEFYANAGDDLAGDKTDAVTETLHSALKPLLSLAKKRASEEPGNCPPGMTNTNFRAAHSMITSRWQQIHDVVQLFLGETAA